MEPSNEGLQNIRVSFCDLVARGIIHFNLLCWLEHATLLSYTSYFMDLF